MSKPKEFEVALSEKNNEEALKDVSLKIKSTFPKKINTVFVLFTHHYNPQNVLKTLKLTMNPATLLGAQAPLLIFQDRIIEKGVIAWCINKEGASLKGIPASPQPKKLEAQLRQIQKEIITKNPLLFSLFSSRADRLYYRRNIERSFGKSVPIYGAGYIKRVGTETPFIIDSSLAKESLIVAIKGLEIEPFHLNGFLPLGKPFTITNTIGQREVIVEINHQPAINIYKQYLQDKFTPFSENRLYPFYPLKIQGENTEHLISVIDALDDGSLICIGNANEKDKAHLMISHPPTLLKSIKDCAQSIQNNGEGIIFVINSLLRKKIFSGYASEEIKTIKKYFGANRHVIGIYSGCSLSPNKYLLGTDIESANTLITLWH